MRKLAFVLACSAIAGLACAQNIFDTSGNTTMGTASVITRLNQGFFSGIGVGNLNPANDVDFYSIHLYQNDLLTVAITPLMNHLTSPEVELGLFDGSGHLLSLDAGNSGNGFQALGSTVASADGTYFIGVTGYGDDGFVGHHTQQGQYQIVVGVSPVPEPASIAALGVGLVCVARRRRSTKGGIR